MDDLPLWVEIDLARVRRNVSRLKGLLKTPTELLAVVKANAYGHGDVAVAKAAIEGGADQLAVARVQEGEALRSAGIVHPVLLLAEPPIGAVGRAVQLGLRPTIYSRHVAHAVHVAGRTTEKGSVGVHVKVDTGMHRYGVSPDDLVAFLDEIQALDGIEVEGIWSHFAVAEDVLNPYTKQQFEVFMDVLQGLGPRARGWTRHMANSAATLTYPEAHLDMVRVGIAIYGIHPSVELADRLELEPALAFKSRVGLVKRLSAGESISYGQRYTLARDALVATIPCGYADGLRRALGNTGDVLIGGKRYRISGTITMDHFLVDVGDDDIKEGDEVVMIGDQGAQTITAQEVATLFGSIPYEVVCGISSRVPRVLVAQGGVSDG